MMLVKLELSENEIKDLLELKKKNNSFTLSKILENVYSATCNITAECDLIQSLLEERENDYNDLSCEAV